MMKLFNIKQYGYLYIDQIIFESYYPILFTLKNDNDDLFLCVCHQYDYEGQKWLLTRTTPETVIEMLSDKIYLRDAFLKYDDLQVSIELDKDGEFQYHYDVKEDWDRDNSVVLPDPEEYLDVEPHEFDSEIEYYKKIISLEYSNNAYFDKSSKTSYKVHMIVNDYNQKTIDYMASRNLSEQQRYKLQCDSRRWSDSENLISYSKAS